MEHSSPVRMAAATLAVDRAPSRPGGTILSIQYLRACAALMVVFHHAASQFSEFPQPFHTTAGQSGVDLFFAISGFVMVFVTATREQTPGSFLLSRATRIIPIYWFYTLACFGLILVAPRLFTSNEASARHLILSLLFVPHVIAATPDEFAPVVKLGWTLNYEVFFYLVFTLAMIISFRRRVVVAVALLLCLLAVPIASSHFGVRLSGVWEFYTNRIMAEFAFGMMIAIAYFSAKLDWLGALPAAILLGMSFICLFLGAPYMLHARVLVFGVPAALILIAALAIERRGFIGRSRLMTLTGDASYSIYLVHIFPLAVLRVLWREFGLPVTGWIYPTLFVVSCLGAAIFMGILSYLLIETPLLHWVRKQLPPKKPARTAVSQAL